MGALILSLLLSAWAATPEAESESPKVTLFAPEGPPAHGDAVALWAALSVGGRPAEGPAPVVEAGAGTILEGAVPVSPGVWELRYLAPDSGEADRLTVLVGASITEEVLSLRPRRAPTLLTAPSVIGQVGQPTPLVFLVSGPDLPPPESLQVSASEGKVLGVDREGDALAVRWQPDGERFPRAVPLGFRDSRRAGAPPAWTVAMLRARPRVPVQTEPGAAVTLRVGGRSYGPFVAGADGVALANIEVRPGEQVADLLVEDRSGNSNRSTLSLTTAPEATLVAMVDGIAVAGGDPPRIELFAVAADGRPWAGGPPRCETSLGDVPVASPTGPGTWRLPLLSLPEDVLFDLRVECALEDKARVAVRIPVEAGGPARLLLRTWPESVSADQPVAQVQAFLENRLGERVSASGLRLNAELGTIESEDSTSATSLRATWRGTPEAVAAGGDTLHAQWEPARGTGAAAALYLSASPSGDGALSLAARLENALGQPLAGRPVSLCLDARCADLSTDDRGWARAPRLTPESAAPYLLEARAGALLRREVLFLGATLGPDPDAPTLAANLALPIVAGRVREVFLSTEPRTLSGAPGETALVEVRLVDSSGRAITDEALKLEASAGTLSPTRVRPDGTVEATWTPPADPSPGTVRITATGGAPGASFTTSTELELSPREVRHMPGAHAGVLIGAHGLLSPWIELGYEERLLGGNLPLFARFTVGTFGARVEDTDEETDAGLRMDLRAFPVSLGVISRAARGRYAGWLGGALVVAPYQLDARFDGVLAVHGPGLAPPGASLTVGASRRFRDTELVFQLSYLFLTMNADEIGWTGALGGVVGTVGTRLLY